MLEHIVPIIFSILISGVVFYLLRKKITSIESKVNLMFQLIQEHEKKEQLRNTMHQRNVPTSKNTNEEHYDDSDDELINVSDNEDTNKKIINNDSKYYNTATQDDESDDYNSDDSDSSNEETDNEKLNIEEIVNGDSKNKIINLEVENSKDVEDTISLKEITKVDNLEDSDKDNLDNIDLSDKDMEQKSDIFLNSNSNNKNSDNTSDQDSEEDSHEDSENNNENTDNQTKQQINKKNKESHFKSFTVSELKQECEKRNLEGFKSLKKTALIDLLQNS